MGIARGTNIVRDGLIYGHDSGYGLDNFKPTRFYKGKPAVNMLNNGDNFGNWNKTKNSGSDPTVTSDVAPGPFENTLADKLFLPNDGSYPRLYQYFTPASTATHTFSVWLKAQSPSQGVFVGAFRNSPWALPSHTSFDITDEWVNYTFAVNPLDTSSHQIYIGSHDSHKGKEFLIYGAQLETGSSRSTFVDGTRSNTGGLIDLKRTRNIDVANMSFNSTGQPTFDGTDDEINTGITTQLNAFSCVVIFKDDGSASWGRLVDKQYTTGFFISSYFASVGNNYVGAGVREPNSPHGQALQYDDTKYNYFVLTRSGSTHTIYLNGSTNKLQKTNGDSSTLSSTEMAIGAWNGSTDSQRYTGEIPVVKLYNKELTAAEIQQDFEAYKNRFNI